VEDDPERRGVIERLLAARGYLVVSLGEASKAADLVVFGSYDTFRRKGGAQPAVLVLPRPFSPDDLERRVRVALDARDGR